MTHQTEDKDNIARAIENCIEADVHIGMIMKHSFISVWVMMRSLEGGLGANFDPLFYLGNGSHAFDQLLHMRCCFQKIWRSLDVKVEKVHERQIRPCQLWEQKSSTE